MSIETFLKMHQPFSEVISQMEAKGLIRKTDSGAVAASSESATTSVKNSASNKK